MNKCHFCNNTEVQFCDICKKWLCDECRVKYPKRVKEFFKEMFKK